MKAWLFRSWVAGVFQRLFLLFLFVLLLPQIFCLLINFYSKQLIFFGKAFVQMVWSLQGDYILKGSSSPQPPQSTYPLMSDLRFPNNQVICIWIAECNGNDKCLSNASSISFHLSFFSIQHLVSFPLCLFLLLQLLLGGWEGKKSQISLFFI